MALSSSMRLGEEIVDEVNLEYCIRNVSYVRVPTVYVYPSTVSMLPNGGSDIRISQGLSGQHRTAHPEAPQQYEHL